MLCILITNTVCIFDVRVYRHMADHIISLTSFSLHLSFPPLFRPLLSPAWGRPDQEEPRRKHTFGPGEGWGHRHPGPAKRRCRAAGCRQERLPGKGAEAM